MSPGVRQQKYKMSPVWTGKDLANGGKLAVKAEDGWRKKDVWFPQTYLVCPYDLVARVV